MQTFQSTREAFWYRQMSFSPDGRWLALSGKPFTLLDTTDQEQPAELPLGNFRWGFVFVRRGAALADLPTSGRLCEYEPATRSERQCIIEGGYTEGIAADSSGETLYLTVWTRGRSRIRVLGASDFHTRAEFGAGSNELRGLTTSADGRWLAAASTSHKQVRAWHVGGAKLPSRAAICATPKVRASGFALSADGGHLAVVSSRGLEIWNTRSGGCGTFSGKHRRGVSAVACCPTKPTLVTGDNAGQVFLGDHTGRVLTRYDWALGAVGGLCFAPDGLRCAAVDTNGKVVVWDVDLG